MPDSQRILVVDDADLVRTTLLALLRRVGHEVRLASSVAEARRGMVGWIPDVVVLDHRLPDGDGIAFARELRDHPELAALRIVVMSGDPLPDVATSVPDIFLLKPAGARDVLAAVEGSTTS